MFFPWAIWLALRTASVSGSARLSMLNFAVNSVAMGNARDDVKKAARHVCATNAQDGVARFVARHVLGDPLPEGGTALD